MIQNNVHHRPGDTDCREREGKIPKCLDSFVQVYIYSVFTCTSTNDDAYKGSLSWENLCKAKLRSVVVTRRLYKKKLRIKGKF